MELPSTPESTETTERATARHGATDLLSRGAATAAAKATALPAAAGSAAGTAWEAVRGTATQTVLPALGSAAEEAWGAVRATATETVLPALGSAAGEALGRAVDASPLHALGVLARTAKGGGRLGRRDPRWPLLASGLGLGLAAGVLVARRRAAAAARRADALAAPAATGNAGGVNPATPTTGGVPATGAPVAPGRPPTTTAVGGSDAPRPLGQPVSGGVDPVADGGAGAASGPAQPAPAPAPEPSKVTELPAATGATPDGDLTPEG